MAVWHWLLESIQALLAWLHTIAEPIFGVHAWGAAIVLLTVVVRVALLPLAAKQFKSMRGMQQLQPEMQRLKKKYKVDRELMKKDPAKYKAQRQKMNEEMMALYREHGVNPAAGCLPLLLQAPIFFAIFRTLIDADLAINGDPIQEASFYMFSPLGELARVDVWGWLLVVGVAGSMFLAQKQMMAKNPASEGFAAQQQKIMLYGMPVFLGVFALNLPIGVLLYWVTTNSLQILQQTIILREVKSEVSTEPVRKDRPKGGGKPEILDKPRGGSRADRVRGDGQPERSDTERPDKDQPEEERPERSQPEPLKKVPKERDHLPRRRRGRDT